MVGSVLIGLAQTPAPQTANFDRNGNLIWIGGLLEDSTGCEASQTFIGKVFKVEVLAGDDADSYELLLTAANGKRQRFQTTLSHNEGAILPDFEEMIQRNRRLKVKARRCGSGGYLTVEEVWHM